MISPDTSDHLHRTGNTMSPLSRAVLAHVAQHPGCTLADLLRTLLPEAPSGKGSTANRFGARVAYLVSVGHLKRVSSDNVALTAIYHLGEGLPAPVPKPTSPPAQACRVATDTARCQVVPPRQFDRLHGPTYVPEPGPVVRPGGHDFLHVPSVGDAC